MTHNPFDWDALLALLNPLLEADLHCTHNRHKEATTVLADLHTRASLPPLTPAAQLVVHIKSAQSFVQLADKQGLRTALRQGKSLAKNAKPLAALWQEASIFLTERLRYNQTASKLKEHDLQKRLDALQNCRAHIPRLGMLEAERQNLQALLERRMAMQTADAALRERHTRAAILHLHGALLLALLGANYQQVQKFGYNLSLVSQLAEKYVPQLCCRANPKNFSTQLTVLRYVHRCCTLMGVGDDSQWVRISLAEEWLKCEGDEGEKLDFSNLPNPATITFWSDLVRLTEATHSPREIAHAYYLAHIWYSQRDDVDIAQRLQKKRKSLYRHHPGLQKSVEMDLSV